MKYRNDKPLPGILLIFISICLCSLPSLAVTSKVTRHSSGADFLKGQGEDVIVSSAGYLQLGRAWEMPVEEFEDVWSINTVIVSGPTVFLGTSPNGAVYRYSLGELTKIYPVESDEQTEEKVIDVNEPNDVNDPNRIETEEYFSNEHIFAMATDLAGRLLVGTSGKTCALMRFEKGQMNTIFEPNDAKYIFAIATGPKGNIYLGTGPGGKVYGLDSLGNALKSNDEPGLVYESRDKNILSLTVDKDGLIYAGSDSRGLVYRIDPVTSSTTVLYDSEQKEITSTLLMNQQAEGMVGDLYVTATSAKVKAAEAKFAKDLPLAGRPETAAPQGESVKSQGDLKLKIANTKKAKTDTPGDKERPKRKKAKPGTASFVYKLSPDGFVTDIFSEAAVFFCLAGQNGKLLLGTGNDARLFVIDIAAEEEAIVYEDEQASQITAIAVDGNDVYIGTANPAKLVELKEHFSGKGTYTSDLIDAGQPGRWGKLQIEADIPKDCRVMMASRSGNVKDVNDPTFSKWSELTEVTGPAQLSCPLGRFCQYKLVLQSPDGRQTPLVREVAVAHTVPNLAPRVESVSVDKAGEKDKVGLFKIEYKAKDDNDDKLIYKIDFRKVGRTSWIELKDEVKEKSFKWDGKTVEDGRYEIRITADDQRSNTTETKLTSSRISDPVVIDNTGPVIEDSSLEKTKNKVTLKLSISDALSVIGKLEYTIDSNDDWIGTLPQDLVYDTAEEDFTIVIEDLDPGQHVVTIKVSDDVENTTYKSFDVEL